MIPSKTDNPLVSAKKVVVKAKVLPTVKVSNTVRIHRAENLPPPAAPIPKAKTRVSKTNVGPDDTAQKANKLVKENVVIRENAAKVKTRLSNEFEKTENTLYCTALEEM